VDAVCFHVEVSAMGRLLVQRCLTAYICLRVVEETRRGALGPLGLLCHENKRT